MPKFCGIQKKINCLVSSGIGGSVQFRRRRMGISSSGTAVDYDIFGEPINIDSGDIYNDITFYGTIDDSKTENDENSNFGGTEDNGTKGIIFDVSSSEDVIRNDLIEYPVNSNEWYRVNSKGYPTKFYVTIKAVVEARSSN